jgi:signal transduction histidine kinase
MTADACDRPTICVVRGLRHPWLDPILAAVLTGAGLAMTFGATGGDSTVVDSLVLPAVTLPVAWRRRAPLAVALALAAGMVISGAPTFDQTRCGVAIPAALLVAFTVASTCERRDAAIGLVALLAGVVFLLFTDSQLDAGAAFLLPLTAGVWGAGRLARSRAALAEQLRQRAHALDEAREQTAQLAVEVERLRLASDLDSATRSRLEELVALADETQTQLAADPGRSPEAFARIEQVGRESLNELREMLGVLEGDALDTAPQPTLAQLDALVEQARARGATVELAIEGERRPLPGGIELAAYRAVEHSIGALAGEVSVRVVYGPDTLELEVSGTAQSASESEAAMLAARERVLAHGGRFTAAATATSGRVVHASLPLAAVAR